MWKCPSHDGLSAVPGSATNESCLGDCTLVGSPSPRTVTNPLWFPEPSRVSSLWFQSLQRDKSNQEICNCPLGPDLLPLSGQSIGGVQTPP